jgi:signal transduction histidine kinase
VVQGDEAQLVRLFRNLIGSALKYHGPDLPKVHISARKHGSEWIFAIADNGIGIEEEYREQIFDAFRRPHTSAKYEGTGLGLAICKRIVQLHGGRIWVESEQGKGSCFYFTLSEVVAGETSGPAAHVPGLARSTSV